MQTDLEERAVAAAAACAGRSIKIAVAAQDQIRRGICAVAGAPLAKPQQSTEAELQAKLDGARQRLRQIVVLGLKSWLLEETPKELAKIEGYARGQVRVHHRILERFRDGHRH